MLSLNSLLKCCSFNALLQLHTPYFAHCSKITHSSFITSSYSHFTHSTLFILNMSSSKDPASIAAISPLTSANYCLWADDMKSWLQLNGLWCLVSGQEKKPAAKPEIKDSKGQVVSKVVALDEDKLERWEVKAE